MKWDTFTWDSGVVYDAGTTSRGWLLQIDWDGDGDFGGENESPRVVNLSVTRGRRYMINAQKAGFEPVSAGTLNLQLDNDDDRYDPYNTSSPLYPYVRPGAKIQVKTKDPATDTEYAVFAGTVSDIQPLSGHNPKLVSVSAVGGFFMLAEAEVAITTRQNIALDDVLGLILDETAWAWTRSLDTSPDVFRWFWIEADAKAQTVINRLMDGSLGTFFQAADGAAKFYERNKLVSPAMTIDQSMIKKEIQLRQPWEVVRNVVNITARPREEQAVSVLWKLFEKPYIPPGETVTYWAAFSYASQPVPVNSLEPLVSSTDYILNTDATGAGTDLTGSCVCTVTAYSNTARIVVANNSSLGGYLTILQIRGKALASAPVVLSDTDAASAAIFGNKIFSVDPVYLQDTNVAKELVGAILINYADAQMFPIVQVENQGWQFALDLFDTVTLDFPAQNLSGDYRVSYIEHQWMDSGGQAIHTVLGFEPVMTLVDNCWRFTAEMGISTRFAF